MGTRGPKSKRTLKPVKPAVPRRPNPMIGMAPTARTVWLRTVKAYPVDHFKPQHYGMLRAYCEAEALNKKAASKMVEMGEVIEQKNGVMKQNPYNQIFQNTCSIMAQLGTKLGITKNNTTVNRGVKGSVPKPKSKRDGLIFNSGE
jgi:phage terminase small subunit